MKYWKSFWRWLNSLGPSFPTFAIALLLVSSGAVAAPQPSTWRPPARFDHSFNGRMVIHYQSLFRIMWGGPCAGTCWAYTYIPARGSKVCHSYIPLVGRGVNAEGQRELIRHERGHCNGWPPNHPK